MEKNLRIDRRCYGSQRVFVFRDHELALIPWAELRRERTTAPLLLTLDHHTDTWPAFNREACKADSGLPTNPHRWLAAQQSLLKATKFADSTSIEAAVKLLGWDEHIDTAIKTDIVAAAFVLAHNDGLVTWPIERLKEKKFPFAWAECGQVVPPRPHHYEIPDDRIFYLPNEGGDVEPLADQAICSAFLEEKLSLVTDMLGSLRRKPLAEEPYILDIDLDYFLTLQSLRPQDARQFHALLRDALAVTIATEPACVRSASQGKWSAEQSLAELEVHLVAALGGRNSEAPANAAK